MEPVVVLDDPAAAVVALDPVRSRMLALLAELPASAAVVTKGQGRDDEGYSAMAGQVAGRGPLVDDLAARGVDHLYVGGLATDYCVRHSVLDALRHGIGVTVLTDAIRAVDVQPGDGARALDEMRNAGAAFATSAGVLTEQDSER